MIVERRIDVDGWTVSDVVGRLNADGVSLDEAILETRDYSLEVTLVYDSEETAAERQVRERRENKAALDQLERERKREAAERAIYEELKAKFEGSQ